MGLRCLVVFSQILTGISCLHISSLWVPETFLSGTVSSTVLDCVYNYTKEDRDSLEVKWYFRHNPSPVYQWLPPGSPQVLSEHFKNHLVPQFEVTQDPYTRYRALNLVNIDSSLSGLYSCRVSSNLGDSFLSKTMLIYSPPDQVSLSVSPVLSSKAMPLMANLSCQVMSAYPQPVTKIIRTTEDGTL